MSDGASPVTLAIDIGGTSIKGALVDATGAMVGERRRIRTPYPLAPTGPDGMVELLVAFAAHLARSDRCAIGFPGMVRNGVVVRAPHFEALFGLGTEVDSTLARQWSNFPLAASLRQALGMPTKVVNDAEMHGHAVIGGKGLEVTVTLGTGFGASVFSNGVAAPHLEFSQMILRNGENFDAQLGNRTRKRIGDTRWSVRVASGLSLLDEICAFDHLYLGGGNARAVSRDGLGPLLKRITVVDNDAGIVGGARLFGPLVPVNEAN